jgi:hypothetical protein
MSLPEGDRHTRSVRTKQAWSQHTADARYWFGDAQAVIGTCPGCPATRSSQEPIAG